jgi:hypothetical protein
MRISDLLDARGRFAESGVIPHAPAFPLPDSRQIGRRVMEDWTIGSNQRSEISFSDFAR